MSYLFNPKVQLAILVVLLCTVVVSLLYGPANMLQNLIAEAAGIALGVWLTVTLVDRMLERRRREKWQEVRSQVFRAISDSIVNILTDYMISQHPDVSWEKVFTGGSKPTVEAADAMVGALEQMRKEGKVDPILEEFIQPKVYPILELFKETQENFSRLRDVLTPRLIEFGEEPKLIELLIDIDERRMNWRNTLIMEEWGAPLEMVLDAAMDTLEALIGLYRYLAAGQVASTR